MRIVTARTAAYVWWALVDDAIPDCDVMLHAALSCCVTPTWLATFEVSILGEVEMRSVYGAAEDVVKAEVERYVAPKIARKWRELSLLPLVGEPVEKPQAAPEPEKVGVA